jgi:hypothetical protein
MTYPQGGQDGKPKRGYQASPEDTYYNLAQYYDIPTISFRCVALVRVLPMCRRGGARVFRAYTSGLISDTQ